MISSKYFVSQEEYQRIVEANNGYPPNTQYIIVDEVDMMEKDGILNKTNKTDEEGNSIYRVNETLNFTTSTPKKRLVASAYDSTTTEPPSPPRKKKQKLSKQERDEIQASAEYFQEDLVDFIPKTAPEPTEDEIKLHMIKNQLCNKSTPSVIEIDDTPPASMETEATNIDQQVDNGKLSTTIKSVSKSGWDYELEWDVDELANVSSINSRYVYHDIYLPE